MKPLLRVLLLLILVAPVPGLSQCPVISFGPDTVICSGSSITLSAGNPGATYLWSDGSSSSDLQTFFEGEYWVDVTMNGCTVSDTVYVQHGPVISADFTFDQLTSCSPLLVAFDETSQACSGSITAWTWDFGDGQTSAERDPSHPYAGPGTYIVSLTVKSSTGASYTTQQSVQVTGAASPVVNLGNDVNLCQGNQLTLDAGNPGGNYLWSNGAVSRTIEVSAGGKYHVRVTRDGCTARDTISVTVVPLLWNDFSFQKTSNCTPAKYQFTDKSNACGASVTGWLWEFGDGTTSTERNPEHAFYTPGQYNVRLTITDSAGNTSKRTRRITVTMASLSVDIGRDTTICSGNSITLRAGNPGSSFLWSTGATTADITVANMGVFSVAVTNNGCTVTDTIHINTAPSVAADFSYTAGDKCLPVKVSFTDSSLALCNQQLTAWFWEFGDGTTSTARNPQHDYYSEDSFSVRLTTTASNGATSTKVLKIGIENSTPDLALAEKMIVCKNDSFQLDAGLAGAEYKWQPSNIISSPSSQQPRARAYTSRWYNVQATKCMVDVRDSIYVFVDSVPPPVISQDGNTLRVNEAVAYRWYLDGNLVPGEDKKSIRVGRNGYYSVEIFNGNGCSGKSKSAFFMPKSEVADRENTIQVKTSPNPTSGAFNIVLSEISSKPLRFRFYDRYGRTIHTGLLTGHVTAVNIAGLATGLYFVETTINNIKRVIPVVVQ